MHEQLTFSGVRSAKPMSSSGSASMNSRFLCSMYLTMRRPQLRTFKSNRLDFTFPRTVHALKETGKAEEAAWSSLSSAFEVFLHAQPGRDIV
ncbi:hypothetical protein CS542_10090 [Pedobacter sp. IW39]|nr:hypothetical protein CS542_10090 [Pedobacter sp. IW39]